ncbi:MAG: hypothetical protein FJ308_05955 [Planctomycetes bacterium]|nr:hypothetical protein [Planctomycetota bacterium]
MLEVCVDSVEGTRIAASAGAQRIEVSDRLDVGGITPSRSLIRLTLATQESTLTEFPTTDSRSPLRNAVALIRCRPGDFYFDDGELQQMHDEAQSAIDFGCTGIAVGASVRGNDLNWDFLESMAYRFPSVERVIHRAFDLVPNPMVAIPRLIDFGYRRILTSGGAERAEDSLEELRIWQESFGTKIEILPAGGISRLNAMEILFRTGCRQLHGSFRGTASVSDTPRSRLPDPDEIRAVRLLLDEWLLNRPQPPVEPQI